jgi:hypothetical protein
LTVVSQPQAMPPDSLTSGVYGCLQFASGERVIHPELSNPPAPNAAPPPPQVLAVEQPRPVLVITPPDDAAKSREEAGDTAQRVVRGTGGRPAGRRAEDSTGPKLVAVRILKALCDAWCTTCSSSDRPTPRSSPGLARTTARTPSLSSSTPPMPRRASLAAGNSPVRVCPHNAIPARRTRCARRGDPSRRRGKLPRSPASPESLRHGQADDQSRTPRGRTHSLRWRGKAALRLPEHQNLTAVG